jgi:hypothetical protein
MKPAGLSKKKAMVPSATFSRRFSFAEKDRAFAAVAVLIIYVLHGKLRSEV